MSAAIAVRRVVKSYGAGETAVHALRGVDLDVHAGEVLLMMGPSGSGKTTLLSIMGGILQATGGSVAIAGREIVGLPERALPEVRLRHIGFVFQGFNLFPALTAAENVAIALDLRGIRGREGIAQRVDQEDAGLRHGATMRRDGRLVDTQAGAIAATRPCAARPRWPAGRSVAAARRRCRAGRSSPSRWCSDS